MKYTLKAQFNTLEELINTLITIRNDYALEALTPDEPELDAYDGDLILNFELD